MIKNLLLFLLFSLTSSAQNYQPIDTADYILRKDFIKDFKLINKKLIKSLKDKYGGETGKELKKLYESFGESFVKDVADKNFLFKSDFETYLQSISIDLKKQNPTISEDLKFLIARNNLPNAYCMSSGIFVINIGLFNYLDNKEQLLSVVSHEISHKILEHSLKAQLAHIENNKKNKETVSLLKNEKYNKSLKALDLFKKQVYLTSDISRKHETEADSLGYELFKKTNLKKSEFLSAMKNLQKFDTIAPKVVTVETYKKLFSLQNQPFKENWLKFEDFSNYDYSHFKEKFNKDSISSHPETVARIEFLRKSFIELATDELTLSADVEYIKFKKIAKMEILPNYYLSEDYGLGVYTALQYLQDEKTIETDTGYYKNWLGKCFLKIYEARKLYQLNRYLDRLEPKVQSKSYQQFLNFMWNLKLDEIKNIAEFYSKP